MTGCICGSRNASGEPYSPYWARTGATPQVTKNKKIAIRKDRIV
jgi:hypothetical protein